MRSEDVTGAFDVNKSDFVLYPNPANAKLNIEFNTNSDNHHSKLLNMMGQIILESDSNEINTSAIPNGIYILKMDALPNYSKKIIVKH